MPKCTGATLCAATAPRNAHDVLKAALLNKPLEVRSLWPISSDHKLGIVLRDDVRHCQNKIIHAVLFDKSSRGE